MKFGFLLSTSVMFVHDVAFCITLTITVPRGLAPPINWIEESAKIIVLSAITAVVLGLICAPVANKCLRSKSLLPCLAILTTVFLCTGVGEHWTPGTSPLATLLGLAANVLLFHAICFGLYLLLPDVPAWKPGAWEKCGYDLTGNVSGVCPECGMEIGTSSKAESI